MGTEEEGEIRSFRGDGDTERPVFHASPLPERDPHTTEEKHWPNSRPTNLFVGDTHHMSFTMLRIFCSAYHVRLATSRRRSSYYESPCIHAQIVVYDSPGIIVVSIMTSSPNHTTVLVPFLGSVFGRGMNRTSCADSDVYCLSSRSFSFRHSYHYRIQSDSVALP